MDYSEVDESRKRYFTVRLTEWARANLRDYPWRNNRNFYTAFVAEFFLQRTKADQVARIYTEFLEKYPDFDSLLEADPSDFRSYFEGLGLIKRYDYFVRTIDIISDEKKAGRWPPSDPDPKFLLKLPGFGKYTVNAVLCFGLGKRVPIVDANVIRIFVRFFDIEPKKKPARNDPLIWEFAEELLPDEDFDIYNYGLIDFGAAVCKNRKPLCGNCPLKDECLFRKSVQM